MRTVVCTVDDMLIIMFNTVGTSLEHRDHADSAVVSLVPRVVCIALINHQSVSDRSSMMDNIVMHAHTLLVKAI